MAPPVFPAELYSVIIRYATYSSLSFDISLDHRFWPLEYSSDISTDYETKKALALVSRQFRSLSLPYVYEVVEVHKPSSVCRLAEVLDIKSSDNAISVQQNPREIKHLLVSLLDGNDERETIVVFNSLQRIFCHCRHLIGFGLYTKVADWRERWTEPHDWLMSIPKGVRFVDWQGNVMTSNFTRMVDRISESVIGLRVSKVRMTNPRLSVSLPKLTHLAIPVECRWAFPLHNWNMPSLTYLSFNGELDDLFLRVVARARDSLRCVMLWNNDCPELASRIPTVAPYLEELTYVFGTGPNLSWESARGHPSLKDIVVTIYCLRTFGNYRGPSLTSLCAHLQPLNKVHFPNLRRVFVGGRNLHMMFHGENRAPLDAITDAWETSGIESLFVEL